MSEPLLEVHLNARYGAEPVINDLRFSLASGEALGLIGTSGAGKSTLVLALLGLLHWRGGTATGEVLFEGSNLLTMREHEARKLRGNRFALIPQSPMSALNSALSLKAHFEEAWRAHSRSSRELASRIDELFEQVQLPRGAGFLARRPSQISVGQAQRILIALALLHRPALVIADEPTSALDPVTQVEILRLLHRLNKESGTAILYVSHDLLSVLQICSRLAVLSEGHISEMLSVDRIEDARHPATLALLRALPVPPEILRKYTAIDEHLLVATRVDEPLPCL